MNLLTTPEAERYRVTINGDRWYKDTLPTCPIAPATDKTFPSVTTVKRAEGADWTAVTIKRLAEAYADNPHIWAGMTVDETKKAMRATSTIALTMAGQRGTNVHTLIESLLTNRPYSFDPADPVWAYKATCEMMLEALQCEPLYLEVPLFNRTLNGAGFAGTADAIVELADGRVAVIDWKSRGEGSGNTCYPGEVAQLGLYSKAEYMIVDGQRVKPPVIDAVIIVSITPKTFAFYDLDLWGAQAHGVALHTWYLATLTAREPITRAVRKLETTTPNMLTAQEQYEQVNAHPAEGDKADPAACDVLRNMYKALPDVQRQWINKVSQQAAQKGLTFHLSEQPTVRRFEILRGLLFLAPTMPDDETVRLLLRLTGVREDLLPNMGTGHLVGSLGVNMAKAFATFCDRWTTGNPTITYTMDGTPTMSTAQPAQKEIEQYAETVLTLDL
jgi:hypothetical protein